MTLNGVPMDLTGFAMGSEMVLHGFPISFEWIPNGCSSIVLFASLWLPLVFPLFSIVLAIVLGCFHWFGYDADSVFIVLSIVELVVVVCPFSFCLLSFGRSSLYVFC